MKSPERSERLATLDREKNPLTLVVDIMAVHVGLRGVRRASMVARCVSACAGAILATGCVGPTSVPDDAPDARTPEPDAATRTGSFHGSGSGTPPGGGNVSLGDPFDGGPPCLPQAPVPEFGAPVTCGSPPPPISGGTLLVTRDGTRAVAADPDRDVVYVVDLVAKAVVFTVALSPGDEPGRLAEDGAGRIHVALRGSGALATLDPTTGSVTARRSACPAPRGVAWQASNDTVWVACSTGELASLPAAGGVAILTHVDRDLRDVIISADSIAVTKFRSAKVLRLASDETIARTDAVSVQPGFQAHVLWRAVAGPSGSIVAVHQGESTQSLSTKTAGGYGCGGLGGGPPPTIKDVSISTSSAPDAAAVSSSSGGSQGSPSTPPGVDAPVPLVEGGAVISVISIVGNDGSSTPQYVFPGVLPVDVSVSPDGTTIAAVAAGAGTGSMGIDNLFMFTQTSATTTRSAAIRVGNGGAIATAFVGNDQVLVQTREPAALWIAPVPWASDAGPTPTSILLSTVSRDDTGHDIFHTHAGSLLACASCHPEGGEDGHVWLLDGNKRRTPSLRGTIAGTAPYHWPGDEADFTALVNDVYVVRMNGRDLSAPQAGALSAWVNAIPAPPAPTWIDPYQAAAGRALFERSDVGCAKCHSGPKLTNNATVDVGTGGAFQVPPLVGVGWRTPVLHDGCAATIADRFGASCATATHGSTASLSATDVANLTAYLEAL